MLFSTEAGDAMVHRLIGNEGLSVSYVVFPLPCCRYQVEIIKVLIPKLLLCFSALVTLSAFCRTFALFLMATPARDVERVFLGA